MKKKLIISLFTLFISTPLLAQEPMLGEIRMFAGNFAPRGWAFCDGQLLSISQYSALFSILGTQYGGDGRTTFALPDLRGRVAIHGGSGPGLTPRQNGQRGGQEYTYLTVSQLPSHNHTAVMHADTTVATDDGPLNMLPARNAGATPQYGDSTYTAEMHNAAVTVGNTGGSQPIQIMQPYNTVRFIIALVGYYPSRN